MSLDTSKLGGPYDVVFDVGAYVGDFARACLDTWPLATVHSFEPLVEPLVKDSDRWHWHRVALGADTDEAIMYRCEFLPSSSMLQMAELHKQAFPYTRGGTLQKVVVRPLEDYAEHVYGRALLKIDVQGYELEVLRGAEACLDRAQLLLLEVSYRRMYRNLPLAHDVIAHVGSRGFRICDVCTYEGRPSDGELMQSDILFAAEGSPVFADESWR